MQLNINNNPPAARNTKLYQFMYLSGICYIGIIYMCVLDMYQSHYIRNLAMCISIKKSLISTYSSLIKCDETTAEQSKFGKYSFVRILSICTM